MWPSCQVVEADQSAAETKEGLIDVRPPLVANSESAVPGKPCQRSLYHPPVAPKLLTAVYSSPCDPRRDPSSTQGPTAAREVVALVSVQFLGPLARSSPRTLGGLDSIHQLLEHQRVMDVGSGEHYSEGYAVTIGHEVALAAGFAAIRRVPSDCFAPFSPARSPNPSWPETSQSRPPHPTGSTRPCAACATHPPPASPEAADSKSRRSPSPWGASPTGYRS
jgi:hypothetical protein